MLMWDEDPRWQQALYQVLLWLIGIGIVGGFFVSLSCGDWRAYHEFLRYIAIGCIALCIYAAVVWTVCRLLLKLCVAIKARRQKRGT